MHDPVGYVGDADTWCEDCALARWGDLEGADHEGNEIGALFAWTESGDSPDACGGCGAMLDTSWSPTAVAYALDALREALDGARPRSAVLDEWAQHLEWCGIDAQELALIDRYLALA